MPYFFLSYVHWCLQVYLLEGVGYTGTGFTASFELPFGCWELNQSPLAEKPGSELSHLSSPQGQLGGGSKAGSNLTGSNWIMMNLK